MGIVVYNPSNAGNAPSIQEGLFAARPATAATGSIYIAWDTQQLFVYDGAWITIGGGTALTANNGITITAGVIQAGGALTKNTAITNGAFTFTLDALTTALIILTGKLIQPAASIPTPGLNSQDVLFVGGMTMYMSNAAGRYFAQFLNNLEQVVYNIVTTFANQFYQWQFNNISFMTLATAGNLLLGSGAGNGSTPRPAVNGDVWVRVGGGFFSQVTGNTDYAGYIPSSANFSLFYNTGASGQFRWLVSKGTAGNAVVAMVINVQGRIRVSSTGLVTDIPTSRFTIDSTTEGYLPPRMSNTQMLAINPPAAADGLRVYNTTFGAHYYWNNGANQWEAFATTAIPGATSPIIVDTANLTGNTGTTNVLSFNVPGAGLGASVYRVNLSVNPFSIPIGTTLTCTVDYDDEVSGAQSGTFFNQGSVTAGLTNGAKAVTFPPITINTFPGSVIALNVTMGGAGPVQFDAVAFVEAIF
jgi:hypothetical protein